MAVSVAIGAVSGNAAGVVIITDPAVFAATTAGATSVGFNGIIPPGVTFKDFNPLVLGGITFATPTTNSDVNVTSATFYSPLNYPADFIDGGFAGASTTSYALRVTFATPVTAVGLDYGQIGSGTGVITFSNGFAFTPTSIPDKGSTTFLGVVSATPITGFSYVVTGGSWVLQDLVLGSPAPGLLGSILWGPNNKAIAGQPCPTCGDPVNMATGNLTETVTDLTVLGRGRFLQLARTYNAQDAATAGAPDTAGFGWTHSYAESLSFDGSGNATVQQGNGSTVSFTASGSVFTAPSFVIATFVKNTDGTYTFTLPDQTADIFSSTGQLLVQTDRNDYQTSLAYNGSGQLVSVTDPAGRKLSFTYGSNGLVSSVTDPIGRKVAYTYDASNNLTAVTDAGGNVTHYAYDASHRLITITDPNGGTTSNTYDGNNRAVFQVDPANRQITFAYAGTTTTLTDGNGHVESQTFTNNRRTSDTLGAGTPAAATATYTYDTAGNRISATDGDGHVWTAAYDARGNQLTSTDPLNRTTTSTYDAQNNLLTRTDPLGVTTSYTYDARGNFATVSRPLTGASLTSKTTFQHGDANHPGDITAAVDALGQTWSRTYNANGDLVQRVDPDGNIWTGSYNGIGWLTSQVTPRGQVQGANPLNFTTTQVYSPLGELLSFTDQLGHVTTFAYDVNRNRVSETDALGHVTQYFFDADNEPAKVTRADGSFWTTAFDAVGHVIGQTDGLGKSTTYTFDALNRLVQMTDPLGRQTRYGYDGAGNRTVAVNAAGQTTIYSYDAANQFTGILYSDGKTPAVSFTYDADGRRTGMTDGTGASTYQYDSLHRLTASIDGAGNQVSYSYDLRGDLTGLTYPSGKQVTRGFDGAGRLTSVKDWLGNTSNFHYDADGDPIEFDYGNGVTGTFGYDQADRKISMNYSRANQSFLAFNYTRNSLELLTAETGGPSGAASYSYDPINRLSSDNQSPLAHDPANNMVQLNKATLTYDAANQLLNQSGGIGGASSLQYDSRGNRVQETGPGVPRTFQYDQANRLTAYGAHVTYAYNGDGLRSGKTVSGDSEAFAWNMAQSLPILLADGKTQFIYGPLGLPLEQVAANGAVLWFHQDQKGSTRALTTPQGRTAATYNYSAYGQRLGLGQGGDGLPALTPLLFAGQYTDAESGLQYLRARYYDASTGQFLTRDPLASAGFDPYQYGGGDPINRSDVSGLCPEDKTAEIVPNWDGSGYHLRITVDADAQDTNLKTFEIVQNPDGSPRLRTIVQDSYQQRTTDANGNPIIKTFSPGVPVPNEILVEAQPDPAASPGPVTWFTAQPLPSVSSPEETNPPPPVPTLVVLPVPPPVPVQVVTAP